MGDVGVVHVSDVGVVHVGDVGRGGACVCM